MNERTRGHIKIQALARADDLLKALAWSSGWLSLAEISRAVGLKKTTVFNLIDTLVTLGFAERDAGAGRYRLGLRNLELGRLVQQRLDIAEAAEPALYRLCAATRETVNLAVPYAYQVLITRSLEGNQGIRVTSYSGTRACFHSTACGKAMLAYLPNNFFQEFVDHGPLQPATPKTIVDTKMLADELVAIRRRGFAIEQEENEIGASCVGAVIRDGFGSVAGSISVAGPAPRMNESTINQVGNLLIRETAAVSRRLGFADGSVGPDGPGDAYTSYPSTYTPAAKLRSGCRPERSAVACRR